MRIHAFLSMELKKQPFLTVSDLLSLLLPFSIPTSIIKTVRPASSLNPYALPLQLTPPGTLTAHGKFCLVLLCSQPDTVHRHPLRETQTSTPLIEGSHKGAGPRPDITPAIADFRYRRPLLSRLHGLFSIPFFRVVCQSPCCRFSCPFFSSAAALLCFLSSLTRTLSSLKNCFSISLHSCSITPRIT